MSFARPSLCNRDLAAGKVGDVAARRAAQLLPAVELLALLNLIMRCLSTTEFSIRCTRSAAEKKKRTPETPFRSQRDRDGVPKRRTRMKRGGWLVKSARVRR